MKFASVIVSTLICCLTATSFSFGQTETDPPVVAVANMRVNLLYLYMDNPIKVAVSGISADKIDAKIIGCGGSITGENGNYVVNVQKLGRASIMIYEKVIGGGVRTLDSINYQVKKPPNMQASFMGVTNGALRTQKIRAGVGLIPKYAEGLEKFRIISFDMMTRSSGHASRSSPLSAKGNQLTPAMRSELRKPFVKSIYFTNIKAKAPDGSIVELLTITIKVT